MAAEQSSEGKPFRCYIDISLGVTKAATLSNESSEVHRLSCHQPESK